MVGQFVEGYCLARKDQAQGYSPENSHWREAVTPREMRTGIEDYLPDEPEELIFTKEELKQRGRLPKSQFETFDVWCRMMRRCSR